MKRIFIYRSLGIFFIAALFSCGLFAEERLHNSPPRVYFISPADGQVVHSPFLVQFGLSAMGVAPAGVDMPDTGHHHLFIDGDALDLTKPLSSEVMHFGSGQTEALIALPTGRHTLQLILGDTNHLPFSPPVISEVITVVVK